MKALTGLGKGLGKGLSGGLSGGLKGLSKPELIVTPDPTLDAPWVEGDEEANLAAELDAVQAGFKARREREASRFDRATDTEFWFAVCFHTRDEKEKFLKALKLAELGDKYLDGHAVAKQLGVEL